MYVWGVWQPNDENGNPDGSSPYTIAPEDAVCAPAIDVCVAYDDPADIPAFESTIIMDQLALCEALTMTELNALGLDDVPLGSNGHSLVGHFCTTGALDGAVWDGQAFGFTAAPGGCPVALDWTYEGSCSTSECPVASGGSSSSGAADSGSGSDGGAGSYDCSAFTSSNVSWTKDNRSGSLRSATVRGPVTSELVEDAYASLYFCGGAKMNAAGKIWDVDRYAFVKHLGLLENDVVKSVNGVTGGTAMLNELADDVNGTADSTVVIQRGLKTITYTVEWAS